ncbi:MAG: zinc ribbon domain-containing protein [Firmicutes bacterium]|nr:zinc ribbon domain-containing protein [Bacillota bacterium]
MLTICSKCGNSLPRTAAFCRHCGTPVQQGADSSPRPLTAAVSGDTVCTQCNAVVSPDARFCRRCGTPREIRTTGEPKVESSSQMESPQPFSSPGNILETDGIQAPRGLPINAAVRQALRKAEQLSGNVMASTQGDMSFDLSPLPIMNGVKNAAASISAAAGPFKVLLEGFAQLPRNFAAAFRDKKKLALALFFTLIWVALTLLPLLDIFLPADSLLSWLTFAQGGMRGGIPGLLGGIFGKGLFVSMLMDLFNFKKNRGKVSTPFKTNISSPFGRGDIGLVIMGIGIALFGYNLMTGDNSLQNSMIGIVAAVGSLRSMNTHSGFIHRLLNACGQKFSGGRGPGNASLGRFMAGMASGFAVAVPLSASGIPWLGYALGGPIFIVGILVSLTARPTPSRGVTA